jgi:hypothetical protein
MAECHLRGIEHVQASLVNNRNEIAISDDAPHLYMTFKIDNRG